MNISFGNILTILPLGILGIVDNCDYGVAIITGISIISVAIINKLPIWKDKK